MEDTWKTKTYLPYTNFPLFTNVSSNYMEDGRQIAKKFWENTCKLIKKVVSLHPESKFPKKSNKTIRL
jgi:hypothetical protein